uniref:LIM zinc-binding domain-containing protein n=1 Tax=Monopterus albus TaxID=43700 RepID=A0A3Q3KCK3_MONAL|nr:filamin-binding LIM protein 1 [Monopterus albus]
MSQAVMASAAPPKRMVSSVFITLASPYQATVTQQQPTLQAHSAPAIDKQHSAVRVGPNDSVPAPRHKKEDHSPSKSYGSIESKDRTHAGSLAGALSPQTPKSTQSGPSRGKQQEDNRGAAELLPPPPPPPPPAALPSSLGTVLSEESALPPPRSVQTPLSHPVTPGRQPVYNREVETRTPSSGLYQDEQSHGIHKHSQDTNRESKEVCGFCRKLVALSEPAIEALNRTYHEACFQCRSCHIALAGKQYYNKAGIPLCEDCYQASLELCWTCGEVITDHVIRALERAYHPSCFTCTTCKRQIGEQAFAQGEVGEVYCLQDYYRKYAPKCSSCNQLIIPKEDGTDSFTVECLGRSYHENCYRCEVCIIQLSPEPNERGCYPLDGKMLCKSCHLNLVSGQQ